MHHRRTGQTPNRHCIGTVQVLHKHCTGIAEVLQGNAQALHRHRPGTAQASHMHRTGTMCTHVHARVHTEMHLYHIHSTHLFIHSYTHSLLKLKKIKKVFKEKHACYPSLLWNGSFHLKHTIKCGGEKTLIQNVIFAFIWWSDSRKISRYFREEGACKKVDSEEVTQSLDELA